MVWFQSTRPRGARQAGRRVRGVDRDAVSIHAPAGGATPAGCGTRPSVWFQSTRPRGARRGRTWPTTFCRCFNPRARGGRDGYHEVGHDLADQFQSTRPRGARPPASAWSLRCCRFNPRARGGRDLIRYSHTSATNEFQSTRPQGARHAGWRGGGLGDQFQSTRPRGARP